VFLELAVLCAKRLFVAPAQAGAAPDPGLRRDDSARAGSQSPIGGNWLAGFLLILRSPYLAGIALWVLLLSLAGTFLYFQQANIVAAASSDPAERTRIFATIDLAIGILTLAVQFVATGRLIERFGVGRAAALLPLVFAAGFAVLAWSPALAVVIAFQAIQRTANFAVSNPAREVLFTVLDREAKYKAKNVIDIVVFRGADALTGWVFSVLRGAGLELAAISAATVPVCIAWLVLALALGRAQEARTRGNISA
jgi:AAA family ATP:ADP antiporter